MSKEILNLVPAIRAIEKEIGKLADDYNKRIYTRNLRMLYRMRNKVDTISKYY